jgi:hypothetical protein
MHGTREPMTVPGTSPRVQWRGCERSLTRYVSSDGQAFAIRIEGLVRVVRLLVPVVGVSGTTYPAGTEVSVGGGGGATVDAFVAGDWLPLRWWEYAETSGDAPR